jgi:hypothetical protein
VLDLAVCSYSGKGHSELGMLRKLWDILRAGDVLLADRYMFAWHEIHLLKQRELFPSVWSILRVCRFPLEAGN